MLNEFFRLWWAINLLPTRTVMSLHHVLVSMTWYWPFYIEIDTFPALAVRPEQFCAPDTTTSTTTGGRVLGNLESAPNLIKIAPKTPLVSMKNRNAVLITVAAWFNVLKVSGYLYYMLIGLQRVTLTWYLIIYMPYVLMFAELNCR